MFDKYEKTYSTQAPTHPTPLATTASSSFLLSLAGFGKDEVLYVQEKQKSEWE